MRINFLTETEYALAEHGKSWDDIDYIVCGNSVFTKPSEIKHMFNFEYEMGFHYAVRTLIQIVGNDTNGHWWLERMEYDGQEWWEFKQKPLPTKNEKYPFDTFEYHG